MCTRGKWGKRLPSDMLSSMQACRYALRKGMRDEKA